MKQNCNCSDTRNKSVKSHTPGDQIDRYAETSPEAVEQNVDELNNIGAPEDQAPDPDTIIQ